MKLSLSDALLARLDATRGVLSRQEYITTALAHELDGSPLVAELRAELERMHATLRVLAAPPAPVVAPAPQDERLGFW